MDIAWWVQTRLGEGGVIPAMSKNDKCVYPVCGGVEFRAGTLIF